MRSVPWAALIWVVIIFIIIRAGQIRQLGAVFVVLMIISAVGMVGAIILEWINRDR
jgi:hypothetical protein